MELRNALEKRTEGDAGLIAGYWQTRHSHIVPLALAGCLQWNKRDGHGAKTQTFPEFPPFSRPLIQQYLKQSPTPPPTAHSTSLDPARLRCSTTQTGPAISVLSSRLLVTFLALRPVFVFSLPLHGKELPFPAHMARPPVSHPPLLARPFRIRPLLPWIAFTSPRLEEKTGRERGRFSESLRTTRRPPIPVTCILVYARCHNWTGE